MQIYAAIPLVYAHEILGQCDAYFLNDSHFSKFLYVPLLSIWFNLEPSYLAQLCTCTGATHREEIMHLSIIFLKLRNLKKIHFALFSPFGIYAKDTKFINSTSYTHRRRHTDRCRYHFYILHFLAHLADLPKIQILYLAYHRLAHAQTLRHAHTQTHVQRH